MAGTFNAARSAGSEKQRREYFYNRIVQGFPERANDSMLLYGNVELEYYRLVNDGSLSTGDQGTQGNVGPAGPRGIQGVQGNQGIGGPQGTQGPIGGQGPRGLQGTAGTQGAKGNTGATGLTGMPGAQGGQGIQGIKGDTGLTGSQGLKGDTGNTGLKGDTGSTGSQGTPGLKGDPGNTGAQGIQGIKGDTGLKGDTGNQGTQGVKGADGTSVTIKGTVADAAALPTKANTPTLANGDGYVTNNDGNLHVWTGAAFNNVGPVRGPTGLTGAQGIQGIKGDTGNTGPQGNVGPKGTDAAFTFVAEVLFTSRPEFFPVGVSVGQIAQNGWPAQFGVVETTYFNVNRAVQIVSEKVTSRQWRRTADTSISTGWTALVETGLQGIQGVKGDTGNQGIQGVKGDIGDTGNTGPQGVIGNTGASGPQGPIGDEGPQGPQGVQGNTGPTGNTGIQGIQGVKGDTGNTGPQGPTGTGVPTGGNSTQYLRGDNTLQALNSAAVGLGSVNNTADSNKPISTPQRAEFNKIYGYLMAFFGNNTVRNEHINLYFSPDGKAAVTTETNPVWWGSGVGVAGPRDPSPLMVGDTLYIAHTINDGQGKNFQIAKSVRGKPFELHQNVDVSAAAGLIKAWAPEFHVDGVNTYIIFTRVIPGATPELTPMWIRATNAALTTWTAPAVLVCANNTTNNIDMSIVKEGSVYYGFYGSGPNIWRQQSTSFTGPYTTPVQLTGMRTGIPADSNLEGPSLIKLPDGTWRMYFDNYIGTSPNYTYPGTMYSEAATINAAATAWSPAQYVETTLPLEPEYSLRHGQVIPITDAALYNRFTSEQRSRVRQVTFKASNTNVGSTDTNTGPWGLPVEGSVNETDIIETPSAGRMIIRRSGYYSLDWVIQGIATNGTSPRNLGGGSAAIKGTPDANLTRGFDAVDFGNGPATVKLGFHGVYLRQGQIIELAVRSAIAGRVDSLVSLKRD